MTTDEALELMLEVGTEVLLMRAFGGGWFAKIDSVWWGYGDTVSDAIQDAVDAIARNETRQQ